MNLREQARYAGRFPVRPHPSAQPGVLDTVESIAPPKTSHTPQRTLQKSVPRKGEREGEIRGLRNSELAPPKGFLSLQTETKLHIKSTIKNRSTELLHQER